jgi:type IV secretion system protein VirB4
MISMPFSRRFERLPELYAPYVGHVRNGVVLLTDGSLMTMMSLKGMPYELVAPVIRKNRANVFNDLVRQLPVEVLNVHLVKHEADPGSTPECTTDYGRNVMRKYREIVLGESVKEISWFISLIVRPTKPGIFRRTSDFDDPEAISRLEQAARIVTGTMSDHDPVVLGRVELPTDLDDETVTVSEVGAALYLIRTGIKDVIPETTGTLGSATLKSSPHFGPRAFDLNIDGIERYGAMISLKDYPAKTRAGMFNGLLTGDYAFSITHSFAFEGGRMRDAKMAIRGSQLSHDKGGNETLAAGMRKMRDDTSSNRALTGLHNTSLAVFSPKLKDLDAYVGAAMKSLSTGGGANAIRERNVWWSGGMEPQYWALLPGVSWTYCRSGQINTLNLAHFASFDGFSAGAARGYFGRSPIRFRTRAGTIYDYIPTVGEIGHTTIIGSSDSGKTVALSMFKTAMDAILGPGGLRILIDKDESNRISIEMEGGSYATFRRNEASGVAPLKAFADTPRNRAFFHGLYRWLILRDGGRNLTPDEDKRLARGIARQLKMPPHLRTMGGVREFLGYADPVNGAGARFERWCAGGPMGWLLDGDRHIIDMDPEKVRLYGYDFTALIPKEGEIDDGACQVAAAVISHQLADYIDGRRIMFVCEEARFYLEPLVKLLDDLSLTGRKSELMLWIVVQEPDHILKSPIGLSLLSQCKTKIIFPNKSAHWPSYEQTGVSRKAFEQLSSGMFVANGTSKTQTKAARRFLIWRGEGESAICEFDLSAMPEELAIMSARAGSNKLLDQIMAGGKLPPAELRHEFLRRNAHRLKLVEAA